MAERNRQTEASNDGEIRAMMAMKRVLEPLDRGARHRVLEWAEGRYVRESIPDLDPQFMTKFTNAVVQAAREIGDVTPLDIIRAMDELAKIREAQSAVDEEVAATREP